MLNFPFYHQMDKMDCGPACLRMVAKHFGKHYSAQTLRDKTQINREGVSLLGIADAAEKIGLNAVGVRISLKQLSDEVPLPCILHWGQSHFVVLYKVSHKYSVLENTFLGKIWGGRKSPENENLEFPDVASLINGGGYKSEEPLDHELKAQSGTLFYIADPARGKITFTETELKTKWLSSYGVSSKEGIALLLEPTPAFGSEEEEVSSQLDFNHLLAYLWQYKKLVLQLGLGMLTGSAISLAFPFLTQMVVDVGIGTQDLSLINLVLIAQMVLMVSTSAIDFLKSWILLHISTRINLSILSKFLFKITRLPLSFFDVKHFGDIMQRIGDHQRIETFLTGQTLNMMFSMVNLVVFGFVLAYYHLFIFIIAFGATLLYGIWILLFLKKRRKLDTKRFEISARNQSQILQLVQGMQDIKLSGAETTKRWELERTQAKLFRYAIQTLSLSQFQQLGGILINNGKNIFISFLAAKAVVDGQLTLGGMMSIQYILGQFNSPIDQMVGFLQSFQDAKISLERLNEVHSMSDEEPQEMPGRTQWDSKSDIVIESLSYTYPGAGNDKVLSNISLRIPFGKTTAIVGTSGSGKTTLLKILLRFYEPQSGSIFLQQVNAGSQPNDQKRPHDDILKNYLNKGLDLKYISHSAWRQQCGVVMQEGYIFSDTIARNIAVGKESIDENKLYQAARTANIHDFIQTLPMGYYTRIGAQGNGISQGQKQRILIARSIYKNPPLLLLDEATNSLDSSNEATILDNLQQFLQNRTVVVVAHRLSTVKNADQIVVLSGGKIIEQGTHDELISHRGQYYELISNQLELGNG